MALTLEPINQKEDKTKEIFASDDCQTLLNMWEEFYPSIGFNLPWVGYFVKQNNKIMGSCALIKKPGENKIEISYWTFKEHEGKGIASWACKKLIIIARKADANSIVTAKTAPENNASTKILQKNGFVFLGVVQDHAIGDAWEWILA